MLHCAGCGNVLSAPVRLVALPAAPQEHLLDHHHVNPPLLEPGAYAVDEVPYGRDKVKGTLVLSPGDVRGTRFVHSRAETGCWSLTGWYGPCLACEGCGALVACRTDDCLVPQETRFYPSSVVRETGKDPGRQPKPFVLFTDWDDGQPGPPGEPGVPRPAARSELRATHWRVRGLKSQVYRDDPPA